MPISRLPQTTNECPLAVLRGAVTIVLQDVLRVRMVYVAIYLNIDYASG